MVWEAVHPTAETSVRHVRSKNMGGLDGSSYGMFWLYDNSRCISVFFFMFYVRGH